jgi:hypothetical protein
VSVFKDGVDKGLAEFLNLYGAGRRLHEDKRRLLRRLRRLFKGAAGRKEGADGKERYGKSKFISHDRVFPKVKRCFAKSSG